MTRAVARGVAILERIAVALSTALAALAGLALVLMMIQTVADVVAKYVFDRPIRGNLEVIAYYYMTAVVFLPLAITEIRHEHIGVDLAVRHLPPRVRNGLYALTSTLGAAFLALLAWQTFHDALSSTRQGEILMGSAIVSVWPPKWFLPLGFGLAALTCLVNAARALVRLDTFDPAPIVDERLTE